MCEECPKRRESTHLIFSCRVVLLKWVRGASEPQVFVKQINRALCCRRKRSESLKRLKQRLENKSWNKSCEENVCMCVCARTCRRAEAVWGVSYDVYVWLYSVYSCPKLSQFVFSILSLRKVCMKFMFLTQNTEQGHVKSMFLRSNIHLWANFCKNRL